ncbi:ABC transporter ATP-binding protein [Acidithiobacillus sp. M4-SHS-6]|uniref:ABC transporter ATP-binding protein n=1 Tax=Acidithiobacillus sp. M4-SHS-6 TaxID=3383024 RepID=UPI0039BE70F4
MARVQLKQIYKHFEGGDVLRNISIDVADGEFMIFIGPSGCGKTTLLRIIAGLEKPTAGSLLIDGEDLTNVPAARRGVGMVFQSYALYPHMTIYENIAFGLKVAKKPRAEIDRIVHGVASLLQIEELLRRKPAALSGGQRQRVAIGRAIARQSRVLLFDEPLSNLDAALRVQMRLELIKLHQRLNTTILYVTHDQVEAMTMADRIGVINQGRLEQLGTPLELYCRPGNLFVAGFIGSPKMNFLDVLVTAVQGNYVTVQLPGDVAIKMEITITKPIALGNRLKLGVRPEHIALQSKVDDLNQAILHGKVNIVEHLGGEILVHLQLEGDSLIVIKAPGTHEELVNGQPLDISITSRFCYLFDQDGQTLKFLQEGTVNYFGSPLDQVHTG